MGPILFNLFLNDIVLFFKNSCLTNYADNNTLKKTLQKNKTLEINHLRLTETDQHFVNTRG